jgi:hypothetical protein
MRPPPRAAAAAAAASPPDSEGAKEEDCEVASSSSSSSDTDVATTATTCGEASGSDGDDTDSHRGDEAGDRATGLRPDQRPNERVDSTWTRCGEVAEACFLAALATAYLVTAVLVAVLRDRFLLIWVVTSVLFVCLAAALEADGNSFLWVALALSLMGNLVALTETPYPVWVFGGVRLAPGVAMILRAAARALWRAASALWSAAVRGWSAVCAAKPDDADRAEAPLPPTVPSAA